jgi:acyl-CoA oxidase
MLSAHAQLSRNGIYTTTPLRSKLSYSVMLLVRHKMPGVFAIQLAQAVTIATRYSVVREQGLELSTGTGIERSILNYKHQHFRIITLIAKCYAMFFAAKACESMYAQVREQQDCGDHSGLPSLHALSAGLKAYVTSEAVDGAEDARKLCGGHGYMNISGLLDIIGACAGGTTFEGENHVMWQQLGRYLLKQVDALEHSNDIDDQTQYLASDTDPHAPFFGTGNDLLDPIVQLELYSSRARRLILKAHSAVRNSAKTPAEAWNEHMMLVISASRAHIELTVLKSFTTYIASLPKTTAEILRLVLNRLTSVFALSGITSSRCADAISFLETTASQPAYLTSTQLDTIRAHVNDLLEHLLPEVVGLTDAWDFTDASLCSALGMYDGNVYENIMRWVEQMPINKTKNGVHSGWETYVDPLLKGEKGIRAKL